MRQSQENPEFKASLSKIKNTLSQKKKKGWGHGLRGKVLSSNPSTKIN
jgi:hypothetical protein